MLFFLILIEYIFDFFFSVGVLVCLANLMLIIDCYAQFICFLNTSL